jgi:hypothetical protein
MNVLCLNVVIPTHSSTKCRFDYPESVFLCVRHRGIKAGGESQTLALFQTDPGVRTRGGLNWETLRWEIIRTDIVRVMMPIKG